LPDEVDNAAEVAAMSRASDHLAPADLLKARDAALWCNALAGGAIVAAKLGDAKQTVEFIRKLPRVLKAAKAIERAGLYGDNAHTAAFEAAQRVWERGETVRSGTGWTWDLLRRFRRRPERAAFLTRILLPELAKLRAPADGVFKGIMGEWREALRALPTDRRPPPPNTRQDPTVPMSVKDLAEYLGVSRDAVDSFLRRWRRQHVDCYINVDRSERRSRKPHLLHRPEDVLPVLRAHFGIS
jgi:hypothetical protein